MQIFCLSIFRDFLHLQTKFLKIKFKLLVTCQFINPSVNFTANEELFCLSLSIPPLVSQLIENYLVGIYQSLSFIEIKIYKPLRSKKTVVLYINKQ